MYSSYRRHGGVICSNVIPLCQSTFSVRIKSNDRVKTFSCMNKEILERLFGTFVFVGLNIVAHAQ